MEANTMSKQKRVPHSIKFKHELKVWYLERARRFERPTLTLARLCSTPELRPHQILMSVRRPLNGAGEAIRTPDPNLGKVMLYP